MPNDLFVGAASWWAGSAGGVGISIALAWRVNLWLLLWCSEWSGMDIKVGIFALELGIDALSSLLLPDLLHRLRNHA